MRGRLGWLVLLSGWWSLEATAAPTDSALTKSPVSAHSLPETSSASAPIIVQLRLPTAERRVGRTVLVAGVCLSLVGSALLLYGVRSR
jgi:hypothetical protein